MGRFNGYHMGNTAENVAQRWQIAASSRASAGRLQAKAVRRKRSAASRTRLYRSRSRRRGETIVPHRRTSRPGTTVEALSKLRPLRQEWNGYRGHVLRVSTTGAAAVVLMTAAEAEEALAVPLLPIVSWRPRARPGDPRQSPDPGEPHGIEKAGGRPELLDLIEATQALAAQALRGREGSAGTAEGQRNGGAIGAAVILLGALVRAGDLAARDGSGATSTRVWRPGASARDGYSRCASNATRLAGKSRDAWAREAVAGQRDWWHRLVRPPSASKRWVNKVAAIMRERQRREESTGETGIGLIHVADLQRLRRGSEEIEAVGLIEVKPMPGSPATNDGPHGYEQWTR